jgi:peptidoglycan/xylan/chitin deacetylase (PgdA/CDA1 family)
MLRRLRREALFAILSRSPISVLEKVLGSFLLIPYYHMISDEDVQHVKHLYRYKTVRAFKEDLEFLLRNCSPISLFDVIQCHKSGRPFPEKSFLLTFDDGFREMSDVVAPILLEKGINATFFVNSAFVDNTELCYLNKASLLVEEVATKWSPSLGSKLANVLGSRESTFINIRSNILALRYQKRSVLDDLAYIAGFDFGDYLVQHKPYLSPDQIRCLVGNGFTVGGHSVNHPLYSMLSLDEQLSQTIESVTYVKTTFDLDYGVFAFPHSDNGVSAKFFQKLHETGLVDLSFGTAGLMQDSVSSHLQRFSLEKPLVPAKRIIAFHQAKRLVKTLTQSTKIARS